MKSKISNDILGDKKITTGVVYKKNILRKKIIETIYREGSKTIAQLCDITKNSVPTVSGLIEELLSDGWIVNLGIGGSLKGGRKPTLYGLNSEVGYILGVDLSRQYYRIGVFNLHNEYVGKIIEKDEGLETTDNILTLLDNSVNELLEKNDLRKKQILGIGISIPGLLNSRNGKSHSFPQLGSKPLKETFENLFGCSVFVEHDTRIMALGEQWFGHAKKYSNVLFINIGSGIGLSMILNGKLYRGHSGFSGEFGHIQMDPNGKLCYCGKIGCLETIASGTAIVKRAKKDINNGKNSIIKKITNNDPLKITFKTVIDAAKMGDQYAIELMEDTGEFLARGISTLINLFNPEAIIIGGEIAEAENLIKDPIQQKLSKYTMLLLKNDSLVLVSKLKEKAGLLGTLPVVMSHLFFPETDSANA
ncbi:MAG: ROK family transcriptional regulator [Bacteroidota bacterium]